MNNSVETRLRPIYELAHSTKSPADIEHVAEQENHAKDLYERFPVVPTIGCEIEVTWSSLFPDIARQYFGERQPNGKFERRYQDLTDEQKLELDTITAELDAQLKPQYEATEALGIPVGSDAYWEFAHRPCYAWQTLATEVHLLMQKGLIPVGYDHSLHVTLGDIEPVGGGMSIVLAGLELAYVKPERILAATLTNKLGTETAWARRGDDGIRARNSVTLELGHNVGTELRTLTVSHEAQAADILHDSQILSAVLNAYRKRQDVANPELLELAALWPVFRNVIKNIWQEYDLPAASWGSPQAKPTHWQRWADVLATRTTDGSAAQSTIQKLKQITRCAEGIIALLAC